MVKYISRFLFRPPSNMREVWDYKNASTESKQLSVSGIDWNFLFRGKSINKKVDILNECLKSIFNNFVPNKVINYGSLK